MSNFERLADKTRPVLGECVDALARNHLRISLPGTLGMQSDPAGASPVVRLLPADQVRARLRYCVCARRQTRYREDAALQGIMSSIGKHLDRTNAGMGIACLALVIDLINIGSCDQSICRARRVSEIEASAAARGADPDRDALIEAHLFMIFGLILKTVEALELIAASHQGRHVSWRA
jgi:hypothetical protein